MVARGLTCAVCGTEAPSTSRFCGECGSALPEAPREPTEAPQAPAERAADPTLLSVPSPIAEPAADPDAEPDAEDDGTSTMVGVYAPSFPGRETATREVLAGAPSAGHDARDGSEPEEPSAPPERPAASAEPPCASAADEGRPSPDSVETVHDAPGFGGALPGEGPGGHEAGEASSGYGSMSSGYGSMSSGYGSMSSGYGSMSSGHGSSRSSSRSRASRGKKSSRPGSGAWIAAASVAGFVVVAVAGLAIRGAFGGEDVVASLERAGSEERLVVEVRGASPTTRVSFDGESLPLEDGRAEFELEPSDVQLGPNVVQIDLVTPGEEIETHQLTFEVPYRLRLDPAGYGEEPPVLRVRVEAPPGAIVLLDDHVVTLDADGRGHRDFPLTGDAHGGELERPVRHALRAPDGTEEVGTTRFVVPMAKLLVERPGTSITTEDATVELAAVVHPDAEVTVDGEPLDNRTGRVRERLDVPSLGTHTFEIRATEDGRAPTSRTIEVRRVASLEREVERFVADGALDYRRVAADPRASTGRKVKVDGLAYHIETKDGKTDLQVLARDCPRGERCPLWVSYPGVIDARAHSWVRIAGEISGEQRFKTVDTGRVLSVPRVDAAFVVPLSN